MRLRGRTGVVVCGGLSRRMGFDKAALEVGGRTLLERALAALRPVCDELLLATGATPRYVDRGLPIVLDRGAGLGPLAGLEAALQGARHERVIVLAVDMPAIDAEFLAQLAERAERDDCDALLAQSALGVEPLCGVYHIRLAPAVRSALDAGERRMTAVYSHALADGRRARLETFDATPLGREDAVRNVNTSADLDRARAELDARASGGVDASDRLDGIVRTSGSRTDLCVVTGAHATAVHASAQDTLSGAAREVAS